jgi:outer membrane protein OmpA-like peptidoglycan-associated protein
MQGGNVEVCAGTPVNLSVTTTSPFPVRYQWTVNGMVTGANQPNLTLPAPDAGGNQNVAVQITDVTGNAQTTAAPVTRNITVRVRPYVRPAVQASVTGPAEVRRGDTVTLTATGQGDCGGALTYAWSVPEGAVTPTANAPQRATFDTRNVSFSPVADRDEVKQVNASVTVRDQRGASATAQVSLNVRRPAEIVRLPDVLFTSNSSRVNNCGKRVLLEEVFPRIRSGAYTVVLVGHTADNERGVANLDRDRAYNAARVLVSGADTQVRVEPDRFKVDWVGTTQTASREPGYCGTSTRPSVAEIPGATIAANDAAAPTRRVEVWLVPAGVPMPPSVVNARDLPATIRAPK